MAAPWARACWNALSPIRRRNQPQPGDRIPHHPALGGQILQR
jgi:hypothetical protein